MPRSLLGRPVDAERQRSVAIARLSLVDEIDAAAVDATHPCSGQRTSGDQHKRNDPLLAVLHCSPVENNAPTRMPWITARLPDLYVTFWFGSVVVYQHIFVCSGLTRCIASSIVIGRFRANNARSDTGSNLLNVWHACNVCVCVRGLGYVLNFKVKRVNAHE